MSPFRLCSASPIFPSLPRVSTLSSCISLVRVPLWPFVSRATVSVRDLDRPETEYGSLFAKRTLRIVSSIETPARRESTARRIDEARDKVNFYCSTNGFKRCSRSRSTQLHPLDARFPADLPATAAESPSNPFHFLHLSIPGCVRSIPVA